MSQGVTPAQKPRTVLSARRLVLLASVAVLGAGVLFSGAEFATKPNAFLAAPAYAQSTQRPVGFADIVEKVKPSVISVRVKVEGGARTMSFDGDSPFPPGSPMERFFRRFGSPDGQGMPARRAVRAAATSRWAQGSGFFISADGYAVTNNHVVDKAESVEVTTDDGKTYTAKVIGTDPQDRHRADQGRRPQRLPACAARREAAAHRRLGARGRQSVRPRRHRHGRHRLGARPRHRRRPL